METIFVGDDEDMAALRDAARGLLARHWPADTAEAQAADPAALRRAWELIAENGWTALSGAADEGGLRLSAVLCEELGRAGCPLPLGEALAARIVLGPDDPLAGPLAAGEALVACALTASSGEAGAGSVVVGPGGALSGRVGCVDAAGSATHLLVETTAGFAIVETAQPGVMITARRGLGAPTQCAVDLDAAAGRPVSGAERLEDALAVLRLMLAARALGAARRGEEMLIDYVGEREQFGRKIGQFQAIQHKIADLHLEVDLAGLAIGLAARQPAEGFANSAAGREALILACGGLRTASMQTHRGFGGISFWNDHETARHFRRIHSDLVRLGGSARARRDQADALIDAAEGPGARLPDFDLGPKLNAFRDEVRGWLAQNWAGRVFDPDDTRPINHIKADRGFSQKLAERGYLSMSWPKAWGGQDASAVEQLILEEEIAFSAAPIGWHQTSAGMIAPTLIRFGTDEQKARYVAPIARGELCFALGYSEPSNGSDLAGLKTRAERVEGGWRINGQKTFTSSAGYAQYLWLAARTGTPESRNRGISTFIVPLDTPGITRHPVIGLSGHEANTMFFDNVMLPEDAIVGEVDQGWSIITAALAFERVSLAGIASRARAQLDAFLRWLDGDDPLAPALRADGAVRDMVARFSAEIDGARLLALRTAQTIDAGELPMADAAMMKVYSSELAERLAIALSDLLGPGALLSFGEPGAVLDGSVAFGLPDSLLYTIGGGTNEIQRTLIAQRGLGLPR